MSQNLENRQLVHKFDQRFGKAYRALKNWQTEKPHGYEGYCEYARSLIIEMIQCFDGMVIHGAHLNPEIKEVLLDLLEEWPPDSDPPNGGSFFVVDFMIR